MIDEGDKLLSTVYDDIVFAEQKAIILPEKYTNAEQFFNKNKSLLPEEQKVEFLPKELTEKEQVSKELQDAKDAF